MKFKIENTSIWAFKSSNGELGARLDRSVNKMFIVYVENTLCNITSWPGFKCARNQKFLPTGQLSKTYCEISPADSLGLNRKSLVFPDTKISLRLTLSSGNDARGMFDKSFGF